MSQSKVKNKPMIVFLRVTDNGSKTARICAIVQQHFEHGDRVLITVTNDEVAGYVDQLLWKLPEESFLPHQIVRGPSEERIAITTGKENYNKAKVLLNLCPEASPISSQFEMVYELLDETHPDKLRMSQQRQKDYQASGYNIQEK